MADQPMYRTEDRQGSLDAREGRLLQDGKQTDRFAEYQTAGVVIMVERLKRMQNGEMTEKADKLQKDRVFRLEESLTGG